MGTNTMSLRIRRIEASELNWANERYAEVDFLPSPATDLVAVALVDGTPAGLGRITWSGADSGELGGMYVFPAFRGSGIAGRLIDYLIAECGMKTLFCLPFEHLRDLYAAANFSLQPPDESVPQKVLDKYAWCNSHYAKRVLLMSRGNTSGVL